MNKTESLKKRKLTSMRLLCSYLVIILAPAAAVLVVYITMQEALLAIQKEKAQNLSNEAAITFGKEVEQLINVAKYITYGENLNTYMVEREMGISPQNYYQAYELVKSYPEYALLNRFIENIYILPLESSYLMQIPRVFPNNQRSMSMMDMMTENVEYEDMVNSLYELGWSGVFYGKGKGILNNFLIVQRFDYSQNGEKAGVVVIELQKKELKSIFQQILGTDTGMAFLVNEDGRILYVCDSFNGVYTSPAEETGWEEYVRENGWEGRTVVINPAFTGINGWTVVTALPQKELLSRIGVGRTLTLFLCIISVLTGVAICLWYWNSNLSVVEQYFDFAEKYPNSLLPKRESNDIWKNFGGILDHVEDMQITLDTQKQWMKEGIVRRILYGACDSEQELENELKAAKVSLPVELPCILVGLEMENLMAQDREPDMQELENAFKRELDEKLKCPYMMLNTGFLSYVLLIYVKDTLLSRQEIKALFENINYAVYSQIPINIFTGISGTADTVPAVAEEYERVCRICEYARYYKLRVPCVPEDLPAQPPVIFTVELEMQLEKTIRNGTREQLKMMMAQVEENYFRRGREPRTANYNLELLRCILLRTLNDQDKEAREGLIKEIYKAGAPWEMEKCINHVWQYFEQQRILSEDNDFVQMKMEIDKYMEQGYSRAEFNLASMAEWMGIPEKKLYRDFKKIYGVSFTSFLEIKRTHYAQELLKKNRPVGEVAMEVGYSSDYSFRRAFKRVVGVTPSDYQKMQENGG